MKLFWRSVYMTGIVLCLVTPVPAQSSKGSPPLLATAAVTDFKNPDGTTRHLLEITLTNTTDKPIVAYGIHTREFVLRDTKNTVESRGIGYDNLLYGANENVSPEDQYAEYIFPGHPRVLPLTAPAGEYKGDVEVTDVIFIDRTWWGNKQYVDRIFAMRAQAAQDLLAAADLVEHSTPANQQPIVKQLHGLNSGRVEADLRNPRGVAGVSPDDWRKEAQFWAAQSKESGEVQ